MLKARVMIASEALQKLSESGADLALRIRKLWKPIWSLLTFSLMEGILLPKKSLSVSIERGFLSVALGSRFLSKIRIKGFRRYAFEEGKYVSPESLASTLDLAIKEMKTPRAGITLSIPRDWVVVRTADLPAAVKGNIIDVMGYELDRLTPLSAESAYYDFRIVGEEEERISLVVWAARAGLIDQYLDALKEENISVERVTTNLSGLSTLCGFMDPNVESGTVCLEIDGYGYEGALIREGTIISTFGGSLSGDDEGKRAEAIARGLGPAIDAARELGITPSLFVTTKDGARFDLSQYRDVPIRALTSEDIKAKLAFDQGDTSQAAVGGSLESLWSGARGLNLLGKGVEKKVTVPVAGTIILIILLLATWIPYIMLPLQREEKRLAEIDRQISLRKGEVKKVEALRKEVEALDNEVTTIVDFKEKKPMTLVLMKELTTILPKSVWLTRARMTDTNADIEGYASSASEILPKLEQSKYFKKVEFASPTIRDVRMNADRFVIKMEIEGFSKEEAEKPKDGTKK